MVFPASPLGIKVELLLNGTWTDISTYVQQRSDISVTPVGRTNEQSAMAPMGLTLTLNNRDGRFTPLNSSGAYYPYVTENTRIRVSINDTSANSTAYSGYRFWGEVSEWPPTWDTSGNDIYVPIVAAGIWRRLSQSTKMLGSPIRRYIQSLSAIPLVAYWTMEDGTGSTNLAGYPTTISAGTWPTGFDISLAANSDFKGADALATLNGSEIICTFPTFTSTQPECWFACSVPAGGDSGAQGANRDIVSIQSGGTIAYVVISLNGTTGQLYANMYNSSKAVIISNQVITTAVTGVPVLVRVSLAQSGSNVAWTIDLIRQGDTAIWQSKTGTIAGTAAAMTKATFAPTFSPSATSNALHDVAIGHLAAFSAAASSAYVTAALSLGGYVGEGSITRFQRLCGEEGIGAEVIGSGVGVELGPQTDDTLANVLTVIEKSDGGFLYESRDQFGLGFRSRFSLQNQTSSLTINYTAAQISPTFSPVFDDSLIRNDVTLTNWDGYSVRAYLATGDRSLLDPPSGVGSGYAYTQNVSCSTDSDVTALAEQILFSGVVDKLRYPSVTIDLSRVETESLFDSVPSLRQGDYFTISNLPAYGGEATVKQLAWGWTEVFNAYKWQITFNAIPEDPWESAFNPGTTVAGQTVGSAVSQSAAGSVSGSQLAVGSVGVSALSTGITARSLGGVTTTIAASAPASPNVGDIWIDSANGNQMNRWNGSSWDAITWTGTDVIAGGSISVTLLDGSVTARAIGGISTTIATTAPGSPNTGDIWIDASSGYQINQFDGTNWNPVTWDAGSVINAGTIDSSLIVAGTIDASLLAAGLVVSGIVDSTEINAATINGGSITAASISAVSIGVATLIAATIIGASITESDIIFDDQNGGRLLVYKQVNTVTTYTSGSGNWTCPSGTLYARVQAWGAGGDGLGADDAPAPGLNFTSAGGGAEYSEEPQLAVTVGNSYAYVVGVHVGHSPNFGGSRSLFTGDSVTVRAHGGGDSKGGADGTGYGVFPPDTGGTGSTNTIHFDGGAAGKFAVTSGGSGTPQTDSYTTPGTTFWTVPNGVTSLSQIETWGAGGGGAGGSTSSTGGGAAGGGGGYAIKTSSVTVAPGDVIQINVGAPGTAGSAGHLGGNGGSSAVIHSGTTVASAFGGNAATTNAGGTGGAGATGDTLFTGGHGGSISSTGGSGGGTGAGQSANGFAGKNSTGATPGAGTTAPSGGGSGGGGGWGTGAPTAGGSGGNFGGGGGGGGGSTTAAGKAGGAGGTGLVNISYTISTTLGGGGGGGGSSAGPSAAGTSGADADPNSTTGAGGAGGIAPTGGGSGGTGGKLSTTTNGTAGSSPGAGGGGAYVGGNTANAGAGANGKIIVTAVQRTLILSIAAVAGTDVYGTSYPIGIGFHGTSSGSSSVSGSTDGAFHVTGNVNVSGTVTSTGGSTSTPTLITTDTWHSLGTLSGTGSANWTVNQGRYQLTTDGRYEVDIVMTATATTTAGTTIAFANALPTAPSNGRSYPLGWNGTVAASVNTSTLRVTTGGVVEMELPSLPSGTVVTCTQRVPVN